MSPAGKKDSTKKSLKPGPTPVNNNWESGLVKAQFEEVCCFGCHFKCSFHLGLESET